MRRQTMLLAPLVAAVGLAQTQAPITQEGGYWVETLAGSAPLEKATRLRVTTRGELAIRGESRQDVGYTLRKRIRAASEAAAREELARATWRTERQGDAVVLTMGFPARSQANAELRLFVPRSLRETTVVSLGGPVKAEDLDGNLEADTGGGQIEMDRIGGNLTVRTGGGNIRLGKVGGVVLCSSGGGSITADSVGRDVEFNTGGGEIHVREAAGPVRLSTGGGNIHVGRAVSLVAITGGGLIDVLQVGGPVVAETGAGTIKVRAAKGVRCNSGGGAIELYAVSGGLRAATAMGNILAELAAAQALEESFLTTNAGDITVLIPSNLAVTVEAVNAGAGFAKIISDFAEIQSQRGAGWVQARGTLNGGGPVLRLTASGTIYLRKKP